MCYFCPIFPFFKLEIVHCLGISRSRPYLLLSNVFKLKNKNPPDAELVFALITISCGLIPNTNLYRESTLFLSLQHPSKEYRAGEMEDLWFCGV